MAASKRNKGSDSGKVSNETVKYLSETLGIFSNRIKRKLKEQEVQQDKDEKRREERHALMLQAMTTIRKAFQETAKIKLSERFELDVAISDSEGWPRIELQLIDLYVPDYVESALVVTAHDRMDRGTIRIGNDKGEILGTAYLCDARQFNKLPLILKKTVRQFLEDVTAYVLNPVPKEELLGRALEPEGWMESDLISEALRNEEVFTDEDDYSQDGNRVKEDDTEAEKVNIHITQHD